MYFINYLFLKENKINVLARKMEKQFAERAVKKPAGGVSVLPERNDEVQDLTVRWKKVASLLIWLWAVSADNFCCGFLYK